MKIRGARARIARRTPSSAPARGTAAAPDPGTKVLKVDEPTRAVFLDRSGRRARRVRRVAYMIVVLALLALALLWLGLGADLFGLPAFR